MYIVKKHLEQVCAQIRSRSGASIRRSRSDQTLDGRKGSQEGRAGRKSEVGKEQVGRRGGGWTGHDPHITHPSTFGAMRGSIHPGPVAIGKKSLLAVQAQARFVRLLDVPVRNIAGLEVCWIGARNGKQFMPLETIVSRRAIKQWSGVVVPAAPTATWQQGGGGVAEEKKKSVLLRPSPAEGARTVTESCSEGTLSTVSEEGWPLGTEVRFAVDMQGNPVMSATHSLHLRRDSRWHMEQPGCRKPQCTLQGFPCKVEDEKLKERLEIAWERRFAAEHSVGGDMYIMVVEQVLQSPDMGEEEIWVPGSDYWAATADPLRDCAKRIVEDMNRNHWEDIRRFCNVYANLDDELEEANMTWADRLGLDLRVLTKAPQNVLEIRIPFTREVADERDARSSLTIMAEKAWEQERSFTPSEIFLATVEF